MISAIERHPSILNVIIVFDPTNSRWLENITARYGKGKHLYYAPDGYKPIHLFKYTIKSYYVDQDIVIKTTCGRTGIISSKSELPDTFDFYILPYKPKVPDAIRSKEIFTYHEVEEYLELLK